VVRRLREAGPNIRVLSRYRHASGDGIEYVTGDLLKGEGIEPAVDGAEIIVHCASSKKGDEEATGNLVGAASRARVESEGLLPWQPGSRHAKC
jgi:nucleoside-diphosphate-sugar epimerase